MQFGIEPTLFELPIENYPITFTAPVELGFAIDDYYERATNGHENTFGYVSYGISASVPLAFMPEKSGSWTFSMTGKGYSLSHTLANANLGRDFTPVGVREPRRRVLTGRRCARRLRPQLSGCSRRAASGSQLTQSAAPGTTPGCCRDASR